MLFTKCYLDFLTPRALLQQFRKEGKPAAGYLFLGAEQFYRDHCRAALKKAVLGEPADPQGLAEIDLKEQPLSRLVDEARSPSLFASSRLIVAKNAENVLPRGGSKENRGRALLQEYFARPAPGAVVLIEAVRFDDRDRDGKAALERIAKFFSAVPETVQLKMLTMQEAIKGAATLAGRLNLAIERSVLAELVEMLAGDMAKIENNLQKLAIYAAPASAIVDLVDRMTGPAQKLAIYAGPASAAGAPAKVAARDIELLVPEARQSGLFDFSDALAHRDRTRALELLDTMSKAGVYWPLQLSLIAKLFREALAANELRLRGAGAVRSKLDSYGLRLWDARARQVAEIASRFSGKELERALIALFEADRELRSPNPGERIVMERLAMRLTGDS